MSGLRDARLKKALDFAPDAQDLPEARIRQAIHERARQAVAPQREPAWWQRLWSDAGTPRAPWVAAFATLALATLVTVMWQGREIPDAKPGADRVDLPAPVASPPAAGPSAAQAPVAPAVSRQAPPVPARQAEVANAPQAPSAPPPPSPPPQAAAEAEAGRERRAEDAVRDQDARSLAKSAPARGDSAETASVARRMAPAPAAAPAPALGTAAPLAASPALPFNGATHLRIEAGSRSTVAPLSQPSRLAESMAQVVREARGSEALDAPVELRVELRRDTEVVGALELAGAQARWTQWRAGQAAVATARPDAAVLQALREELSRLLAR